MVHVAWIKIHIQSKSFSLNMLKISLKSCRERGGGGDVEDERAWFSSSFIALSLAFQFWCFYLGFKIRQSYIIL